MVPRPERDLDLIRRRLTTWLATKLPGATELEVGALAFPGNTGFSNDTLLFDLAWREAHQQRTLGCVARLEPGGMTVFPEYDLGRQFRIMEVLGRAGIPVPTVRWLERDPSVLGAPFYVMDRVDGRIPSDTPPYHIAGWMTEIDTAERAAIWWSGLEVLARIHRLDAAAIGLGFLAPQGAGETSLDRQLDEYERYLAWASPARPHALCERALAWLRAHRPPPPHPIGLCWGDARLGNMIFRDGRCAAVLDWEMAVLGDPEQDFAWWLYFDRHHSEGCDAPRLDGLPGRAESIRRYEEWTGRPVRHLDYYEIFAAFRFAAIMIRVAQQLAARGILPPDSDFEHDNTATRLLVRLLPGG
jgi:aminoglycoside phosphotransferase (APT) family kinase protein